MSGREELEKALVQQVGFLDRSISDFDRGIQDEALRLAVTIRTLVHDTKHSRSLLKQLGVKSGLSFDDTSSPSDRDSPSSDVAGVNRGVALGLAVFATFTDGGPADVVPNCYRDLVDPASKQVPFEEWWTSEIVRDWDDHWFSRRNLVLAVANKEGGAHVDLDKRDLNYLGLTQFGSLGWSHMNGGVLFGGLKSHRSTNSPVPVMLRQIAEEVQATLRRELGSQIPLPPRPKRVVPARVLSVAMSGVQITSTNLNSTASFVASVPGETKDEFMRRAAGRT